MTNDNKEPKNNAPCEDKQEARQLTEEDLEQVTGGFALAFITHDVAPDILELEASL